jgi:serine/threonine-protein kinase RsbW
VSPPPTGWRALFETALMEVVNNVVEHAYPPGAPAGRLTLVLRGYADRVEAALTDRGVEFVEAPPAPPPVLDLDSLDFPDLPELSEGGRGLALARAAADVVEYSRRDDTNRWLVVKRLGP